MKIKTGVKLDGLDWPMWYAAAVADYIHQSQGWGHATITSGLDGGDAWGAPRTTTSGHPAGKALDIRSRDMPADQRAAFRDALQSFLGGYYRVLLEADHFHIELAPMVTA